MKEIKEIAANYAVGKANDAIDKAVAQAYADGYRDGYKDRDEEIPVDIRGHSTEYVDLGLPSGTLWSKEYEMEGNAFLYLPYEKAVQQMIPTVEQWNELCNKCRWEFIKNNSGNLYRVDCTGPNGGVICFRTTGIRNVLKTNNLNDLYFWLKEDIEGDIKKAIHCYIINSDIRSGLKYSEQKDPEGVFSGSKLPIRLVRKK